MLGNWFDEYIKAGSTSTPEEHLADLSKSSNHSIRMRVAENQRTPSGVLESLAHDSHPDVRLAVGTNPSTPLDIVYGLALDSDATVRLGMAEDPSTRFRVLRILANDGMADVSCRAQKTLSTLLASPSYCSRLATRLYAWTSGNIESFA